jgi:pimeloyl-ACP methyl ester carboxylesterase
MNLMFVVLVGVLVVYLFHQEAPRNSPEAIALDGMHSLVLSDGRLLEYGDCGDPTGTVLLTVHGFSMTGAMFISPYFCHMAADFGLRMIAPSMPCFGRSDCYPMDRERKVSEWGEDMVQLLNHLGYDAPFYAAGTSLGCMHAAATAAHKTLGPRVKGLLLMSPTMPESHMGEVEEVNISWQTLLIKNLLGIPYIGEIVAEAMGNLPPMMKYEGIPDCKAALIRMGEVNSTYWDDVRNRTIADGVRATINTRRGLADNIRFLKTEWDFDFADVGVVRAGGRVVVTSCVADEVSPPSFQRWVAGQMVGAELVKVEGYWGHLHIIVEVRASILYICICLLNLTPSYTELFIFIY